MATVKRIFLKLMLLFFLVPIFLHAQNTDRSSSFSVSATDQGFQFFQTITFPEVPDVIRYEVEIERIDGLTPVLVEKIILDVNVFEVSLTAGLYRYRFTAFNRMNIIEGRSEWEEFRILAGLMPRPTGYQGYYSFFYDLPDPNRTLIVNGIDFTENTEFVLVRKNSGVNWAEVDFQGRSDVIIPNNVVFGENMAGLSFMRNALVQGTYEIFIRNPGGLWTIFGEVFVGFRKDNIEVALSIGYSPMFAAFDLENAIIGVYDVDNNFDYIQNVNRFNPVGYNLRLGLLPVRAPFGNFGLEFQLDFLMDNYDRYEMENNDRNYGFFGFVNGISLNFLYQLPLTARLQHNLRLGFGIMYGSYHAFYIDEGYIDSTTGNYIDRGQYYYPLQMNFNFGYALQYFIWGNLFLEAGLDIKYNVSLQRDYKINHLMFHPNIGIGWQLGRWLDLTRVMEGIEKGEDYSTPVTVVPRSEYMLSAGWQPMLLLSGFDMYGSTSNPLQLFQPFNITGFTLRYAYLPYRWDNNKIGFRFEFGILDHMNRTDYVRESAQFFSILSQTFFGLMYQRVLSNYWHANIHAGIGLSNYYDYSHDFTGFSFTIATNFGASAQYFFSGDAYIEAGVDFVFIDIWDIERISMRPGILIGYQFNRNNPTGIRYRMPVRDGSAAQESTDILQQMPDQPWYWTPPVVEQQPQVPGFQPTPEENPNTFNTLCLSIGTSFIDPMLIGTINVSFSLRRSLFILAGFDLGFVSIYEDVLEYFSIYPFANLGFFFPFEETGGFYLSAGIGRMLGNYTFDYGTASVNTNAANFNAGINIGNKIDISYTLRTNFQSVSHKLSVGYVIRFKK